MSIFEPFVTRSLDEAVVVAAPDGSAVRPLAALAGAASFAHFSLSAGQAARPVVHATVQEIWYVVAGSGEMWRRQDDTEEIVALRPGVCLTIPLGVAFQFRATETLEIVAATVPPWPVDSVDEARPADGPWAPAI